MISSLPIFLFFYVPNLVLIILLLIKQFKIDKLNETEKKDGNKKLRPYIIGFSIASLIGGMIQFESQPLITIFSLIFAILNFVNKDFPYVWILGIVLTIGTMLNFNNVKERIIDDDDELLN